jgi:hypothetical protein
MVVHAERFESFADAMSRLGIGLAPGVLTINPAWKVSLPVWAEEGGGIGGRFQEIEMSALMVGAPERLHYEPPSSVMRCAQIALMTLEHQGLAPASAYESASLMVARRMREAASRAGCYRLHRNVLVVQEIWKGNRAFFPIFVDGDSSVTLELIPADGIPPNGWGMRTTLFAAVAR